MFDEILQMVKERMGNNPSVNTAIPEEHTDAVHNEIAEHIHRALQNTDGSPGAAGNILTEIENNFKSGNLATTAITGGLVGSLARKFGLPPVLTGAIAAAVPTLIQDYLNKKNSGPAPATS